MALSLSEAILITVTSIIMVFIVLIGLMLVTMTFKYIFKEDIPEKVPAAESALSKKDTTSSLPVSKDPKMVAALTALIVSNEEDANKTYTVTSVKRIK